MAEEAKKTKEAKATKETKAAKEKDKVNSKLKNLGDQIVGLTLMEVKALSQPSQIFEAIKLEQSKGDKADKAKLEEMQKRLKEVQQEAKATKETSAEKETKETKTTKEAKETSKSSNKIKKLGDEIVGLTLMEAKELGDYLKDEYGIEPATGGAVMVAGPAAQGPVEEKEEKTSFDVILKEFGDKKIQVIKEVRALTGLGLKEAKDLVDNAPKPVKEGLSKDDAEAAQKQLEAVGAVVELV